MTSLVDELSSVKLCTIPESILPDCEELLNNMERIESPATPHGMDSDILRCLRNIIDLVLQHKTDKTLPNEEVYSKFLDHIYIQAEKIFSSALPLSRSATPVSNSKNGAKTCEEPNDPPPPVSHRRMRVQLFASPTDRPSNNLHPNPNFPASRRCDFSPIGSSAPAGRTFKLSDFITPERPRSRKSPKHSTRTKPPQQVDTKSNKKQHTATPDVKPSRRITPTQIADNTNRLTVKQSTVLEPASPNKFTSEQNNFSVERERLKQKRLQLMSPIDKISHTGPSSIFKGESNPVVPASMTSSKTSLKSVKPSLDNVKHADLLSNAALAFSYLLDSGLSSGICRDTHMIIQLLCCYWRPPPIPDESPSVGLILTIHDAVYFSTRVLEKCAIMRSILHTSIIKSLCENDRVQMFLPQLLPTLNKLVTEESSFKSSIHTSFTSVSFQSETDNSKNFPSEKTFIVFKKQRDTFYEILRLWESNKHLSDWSFKTVCGNKIYNMLNTNTDLYNYIHLSKLFVNQLIISCHNNSEELTASEDDCDAHITMLSQLKMTQPDKYRKLKERFTKPAVLPTELSNTTEFNGPQLFFKLFIQVSKDAIFLKHLQDLLSSKLLELNKTAFELLEPDSDISYLSESFYDCILSLRLLAKFLAYIHFLPYQGLEKLGRGQQRDYVMLRSSTMLPLDLKRILLESLNEGRMVVAIPWIVQYLGQVDPICLETKEINDVMEILLGYQKNLRSNLASNSFLDPAYQYLCIEWLLAIPMYKDNFIGRSAQPLQLKLHGLDIGSRLVTAKLLYDSFSELQASKNCLIQYELGLRNNIIAPRKITPVSEKLPVPTKPTAPITSIQQELEDNFFHNQPASLHQMVVYVAERISSSYIKEFRSQQLNVTTMEGKRFAGEQASRVIESGLQHSAEIAPTIYKYSHQLYTSLHGAAMSGIDVYCDERSKVVLRNLLPEDTAACVLDISCAVIKRQTNERVFKWLQTHLTHDYINAELMHEAQKCIRNNKFAEKSTLTKLIHEKPVEHDYDTLPASKIIDALREMSLKTVTGQVVDAQEIADILEKLNKSVIGRQDFLPATYPICTQMTSMILSGLFKDGARPIANDDKMTLWNAVRKILSNSVLESDFRACQGIVTAGSSRGFYETIFCNFWSDSEEIC